MPVLENPIVALVVMDDFASVTLGYQCERQVHDL